MGCYRRSLPFDYPDLYFEQEEKPFFENRFVDQCRDGSRDSSASFWEFIIRKDLTYCIPYEKCGRESDDDNKNREQHQKEKRQQGIFP